MLAKSADGRLIEGDDFHSAENREKMRQGIALTDVDRESWLNSLASLLRADPHRAVLTCSALKKIYRDKLRSANPDLVFIFLQLGPEDSLARVTSRANEHFFSGSLVNSQFATLEPPLGEPRVLVLDAMRPLPELTAQAMEWLKDVN